MKSVFSGFSFQLTKPNRNWLVWTGFGFDLKKISFVICLGENQTEPKMLTPNQNYTSLYQG